MRTIFIIGIVIRVIIKLNIIAKDKAIKNAFLLKLMEIEKKAIGYDNDLLKRYTLKQEQSTRSSLNYTDLWENLTI